MVECIRWIYEINDRIYSDLFKKSMKHRILIDLKYPRIIFNIKIQINGNEYVI